jgi:hypothetical protein
MLNAAGYKNFLPSASDGWSYRGFLETFTTLPGLCVKGDQESRQELNCLSHAISKYFRKYFSCCSLTRPTPRGRWTPPRISRRWCGYSYWTENMRRAFRDKQASRCHYCAFASLKVSVFGPDHVIHIISWNQASFPVLSCQFCYWSYHVNSSNFM